MMELPQEQYVILNQDNDFFSEFDVFKGIPRYTSDISQAVVFEDVSEAQDTIEDIDIWTWAEKMGVYKNRVGVLKYEIRELGE